MLAVILGLILFSFNINVLNNKKEYLHNKLNKMDGVNNFQTVGLLPSSSENYSNDWFNTWGGPNTEKNANINTMALDSLDNIYVASWTYSFGAGASDACLVKYNNSGTQLWNRTWGGIESEYVSAIVIDSLDNIYVAGKTSSFGAGLEDIFLIKYNSSGIQEWVRIWGGNNGEECYSITLDILGNIYITGVTESFGTGTPDLFIVKYNNLGILQWSRIWGAENYESDPAIILDSLDNIFLTGTTTNLGTGLPKTCLVKYNSSGKQQWEQIYTGNVWAEFRGITLDSQNNVYITGITADFFGNPDVYLTKYNTLGSQEWTRMWGGLQWDESSMILVDSSDYIYVSGITESLTLGYSMFFVAKYDSLGSQQWISTTGQEGNDWGLIAVDSINNIFLTGNIPDNNQNSYLAKFNSSGGELFNLNFGGNGTEFSSAIAVDSNDSVLIAGYTTSFEAGAEDIFTTKFKSLNFSHNINETDLIRTEDKEFTDGRSKKSNNEPADNLITMEYLVIIILIFIGPMTFLIYRRLIKLKRLDRS